MELICHLPSLLQSARSRSLSAIVSETNKLVSNFQCRPLFMSEFLVMIAPKSLLAM
jgi:hypothetical protein